MKPLLAATAVLVALVVAAVSGGVLSATGDEPRSRVGQVRVAETDDKVDPEGNPAAREFVDAKKAWNECVKAAPADERACGRKPHPHDPAFGKHGKKHSPPAWAGGPDRREAEPPGHSKRA